MINQEKKRVKKKIFQQFSLPGQYDRTFTLMNEIIQLILVLWAFLFHNPSKCTKTKTCYKNKQKKGIHHYHYPL